MAKIAGRARWVARAARLTAHAPGRDIIYARVLTAYPSARHVVRTLYDWCWLAIIWALITLAALTIAGAALAVLVALAGWDYIVGVASGIGIAILLHRTRIRRLRELIDWLGEDLEARRTADRAAEQRINRVRQGLP